MSKIFNNYKDKKDRTWYNSSNILYSECDDKSDELKTVRVVFNGGRQYEYKDVKVNDYLMFRESASQGKALNTYLKQYECSRVDDANVDVLNEDLIALRDNENALYEVFIDNNSITLYANGSVSMKLTKNENGLVDFGEVVELLKKCKVNLLNG